MNKLNYKRAWQLLFWLIVTVAFFYDRNYLARKLSLGNFAACVTVRVGLIMLLAWLHWRYLVNMLLKAKRYIVYGLVLMACIALYTLLQCLYDYYLYGIVIGDPEYDNIFIAVPYNAFTAVWYLLLSTSLNLSLNWYEQKYGKQPKTSDMVETTPASTEYIYLKSGSKQFKTALNDITFIEGLKDYSVVNLINDNKIIVKGSLKTIAVQFPEKYLLRVHKSYLVPACKIENLARTQVGLSGGLTIPVGRNYYPLLNRTEF